MRKDIGAMAVAGAFFLALAILTGSCSAFNVDLDSRIVHRSDQPESMFGFTVALHSDKAGVKRLLVGAPSYDTFSYQAGVRRGGAVLKCSAQDARPCEYVPFDRNGSRHFVFGQNISNSIYGFDDSGSSEGNNVHPIGEMLDDKSFQWFGATLRSRGGVVVACAPRYKWFTESLKRREPVGTCYVARNDLTDFQEYSPCRTREWGYHRQGSCQAGFDAALSPSGDRLFIGAPGAYYWQGQIHSQSLHSRNVYERTGEGPAILDDQLLGYSVGAGDFTGDGIADVALGVPKGLNYTGKIAIYSHDLIHLHNITGYQLGSYFGYCLAVTDFNKDGRDDLIVGAPLYTDYSDREMKYETGRVHVLLQNSAHGFKTVVTLEGEVTKGRFGLSVAAIGDINMDGYNDIAVGAPYGGPDGLGAVFIYHGFGIRSGELRNLGKQKPAQVIYSRNVGPGISTFGWSVAGGQDVDNNQYPDVVVGAYLANAAVLLKTRPIVTMVNHTLIFKSESRSLNLEQLSCPTSSGVMVPCVDLELCLSYTGVGVGPQARFTLRYALDEKVNEPRIFFIENNNRILEESIIMNKDTALCKIHQVYALTSLKDKLSPLTADLTYSLVETTLDRQRRSALRPILDQRQPLTLQDAITIQKNCGPDNICYPDLIAYVEAPDTFILGKPEQLTINVRVTNDAEDAFEASVYIPVPPGLLYNKFVPLENTSVTCSPRKKDGQTVIICDIGNPLPMLKGVVFDVLFQQSGSLEKPHFEFIVIANSTNREANHTLEDNVASTNVVVNVDTELLLYGNSEPEQLEYNITHFPEGDYEYEEEYGPEVIHKYGLSNKGPSDVLLVDIVILWPLKTQEGNDILYLLEQPFTSGPVVCDPVQGLNPLQLKLTSRAETYKRLKLQAGLGGSAAASSSSSSSFSSSSSSSGSSSSSSSSSSSFSSSSSTSGSSRQYEYSKEASSSSGQYRSSGSSASRGGYAESSRGSYDSASEYEGSGSGSGYSYRATVGGGRGSSAQHSQSSMVTLDGQSGGSRGEYSRSRSGTSRQTYTQSGYGGGGYVQGGGASGGGYARSSNGSSRVYQYSREGHQGGNEFSQSSRDYPARGEYAQTGSRYHHSSSGYQRGAGGAGAAQYTGADDESQRSSSSSHYSSTSYGPTRTYSSSSSSSSSYKSESASQNQVPLQRYERAADESPELDWEAETTNCGATDCATIRCTAGPLAEGDDLYIYLRSRVNLHTLEQYVYKDVKISSRMVARVRRLPQRVSPDFLKVRSLSVSTPVSPAVSLDVPPPIPWWIIVLACLLGLAILLIIILILWRCGYFERKRPEKEPVDEASRPLHSNGRSNGHPSNRNGKGSLSQERNGHGSFAKPFLPGDEAL